MKQNSILYIVVGVVIGFSVAFIIYPPIQTTKAKSTYVYPIFSNSNPQTLSYALIAKPCKNKTKQSTV